MSDNLLPCPFCGERPQTKEWNVGDRDQIKIWCDGAGCHVHPSVFGNRETMLQQWNTRFFDDVPKSGDQLAEALEFLLFGLKDMEKYQEVAMPNNAISLAYEALSDYHAQDKKR